MSSDTSNKGAIAEFVVIASLVEQGFEVFKDVSGASTIDLFAYKDGQFKRIQVKCRLSLCGAVKFLRYSGGREIKKLIQGTEFDVMALYVRDKKVCLFVKIEELIQTKTGVSIRIDPPKNKAKKNVRWFEAYLQA